MLIKLYSARILSQDPTKRFAKRHNVDEGIWLELWKRYKILDYSVDEMSEYFTLKTKKILKPRQIRRWIFLSEVYTLTKPAREKGARVISTEMFGPLEEKVVLEITRGMRECGSKKSNILV